MNSEPRESAQSVARRLLSRKEAAQYCSICTTTFDRVCKIRPVLLGDYSSKLKRYDIRDIDAWIESKKVANSNVPRSKQDIIDGLCQ